MAEDSFSLGNEAFVLEDYTQAIKCYSDAISIDDSNENYYVNRSKAYILIEKYEEAIADATKAIQINPRNAKAYDRKGISLYNLGKYAEAREAFIEGQAYDASNRNFQEWISKCELVLSGMDLTKVTEKENQNNSGDTQIHKMEDAPPKPEVIPMPAGPKTKFDWYQTETHVIITILVKGVKKEDLSLDVQEKLLSATIRLPSGSDYSLEFDLLHAILPSQIIAKAMPSKVEIKLRKEKAIRWEKLEGEIDPSVKHFTPENPSEKKVLNYPSSSQHATDWDKFAHELAEEEKKEKPEGDAALNALFQQIYCDGTDEVKKAMNKSFVESGGTVLSTNWKDIAAKKTDVKPPDGMQWKNYEQ